VSTVEITLPKWGMTLVDAEVEAPASGTVTEILVADGQTAEVGDVLGHIAG
jgi:pyruvate/2-oxoglutarate dehydrogenase complex dihydrolipoamide acyltransferase (E2) component